MTREQKFPNTEYFTFHNANPRNKFTSDCVIRAISTGTGKTYEETLNALVKYQIKTGYMLNDEKCYSKYLEDLGFRKCSEPRKIDNTKYEVREFIKNRYNKLNCIAHVGTHHIVAIVNSKVLDTWNSSKETMHVYWIR